MDQAQSPEKLPVCPAETPVPAGLWRFASWTERFLTRYWKPAWAVVAAWYLLSLNGLWRASPDSGLYLRLAMNLAQGKGYVYLGEPHRLAYPGLPYLISWLVELSPAHYVALADAAMLAMALLAFAVCYQLLRLMVRPGTAMAVTLLTALNFHLYRFAFELMTDMPFFLGTMLVLAGGAMSGVLPVPRLHPEAFEPTRRLRVGGSLMLIGGLALCAVMRPTVYPLAACLVLAAGVGMFQRQRVRRTATVVVTLVVVVGLIAWVFLADPRRSGSSEMDIYEHAITANLLAAFHNPGVLLERIWQLISPEFPTTIFAFSWTPQADWLIVLILLGATAWALRRYPMGLAWIAATFATQLVAEQPLPRYMLSIIPLVMLGWWQLASALNTRLSRHAGNILAMTMVGVCLVSPVRAAGQIWLEQYRRPFYQSYHRGEYQAAWEMGQLLRAQTPEDALVIIPSDDTLKLDRILTYFSGRGVISATTPLPADARRRRVYAILATDGRPERKLLRGLGIQPLQSLASTQTHSKLNAPLTLIAASWQP